MQGDLKPISQRSCPVYLLEKNLINFHMSDSVHLEDKNIANSVERRKFFVASNIVV